MPCFSKNYHENEKITGNFPIFTCDFAKIAFFHFLYFDFLTLFYSPLLLYPSFSAGTAFRSQGLITPA